MTIDSPFSSSKPIVATRGIHLDLKGVPPTFDRLLRLMEIIHAMRYNAVLVEWEDMFPWQTDERFRCATAYTPTQVKAFHEKCASLGIEVIPLVQCLGHMQNPLDLPDYAKLREIPHLSDCLNPLAPGARELVQKMVDEVLDLTPGCKYFHLGGDEAWTFGSHPDTKAYIAQHGKGALYLHHVEPILDALNARGVRPILWHDMMAEWDSSALSKLAQKADLMFWSYHSHPYENKNPHFKKEVFERFMQHNVRLWGAGAYKGTSGHNADLPDPAKHQMNSLGWADVAKQVPLQGLIATAWSRYSTHQVQNEPIDGALDVMLLVSVIYHDGKPPEGGVDACAKALESIGESARFTQVKDALKKLTAARQHGWRSVQYLAEQLQLMQQDPRRRTGGVDLTYYRWLTDAIQSATKAAEQTRAALAGLIEPHWIEDYLAERIEPLKAQLKTLEPNLATLNPDGFREKTTGQ